MRSFPNPDMKITFVIILPIRRQWS